ncbi:phage tail protein [Lutibacter citreus]|uniref:phage tail protein n=1 Tax=Lutibacter citreus TaxID=2138210 RepID=UPI000DBE3D2F|nr:phage tail protein [Lutibacter citreus]
MPDKMPLSGFHFSVIFELLPQLSIDTKFQSVGGLRSTVEMETISEGGQNKFKINLPKRSTYENLVLKRGLTEELSGLKLWVDNAIQNFVYHPANLVISLLNEKHDPVKVWYVSQAIPVGLQVSDFNAEENSLVIETFTLKYQFFKELPLP